MSELLFLSHRIPYPPDKGDKIRSFHLLKALAAEHRVHVGTFVDDPADWQHVDSVKQLCGGETCVRPLHPRTARLRSMRSLLSGEPLTVAYYRDSALLEWVRELCARRAIGGVFAFSGCMAQYAMEAVGTCSAPRILDLCDVDSDKWRQYATSHSLPMKAIYSREARTLASAEARYTNDFDATLVIAEPEAHLLRELAGASSDRVRVLGNGVDTSYFDPARHYERPYPPDDLPIVFTGAMDYHANIDGVRWFAREIFPAIRRRVRNAVFVIVGSNPTPDVTALAGMPGVVVTGRVPDVRPYLAHSRVVVAPLRIARGVQNKVLEALAMARPVVATPNAVQGIPEASDWGLICLAEPGLMADRIVGLLSADEADGSSGRLFVERKYTWQAQVSSLLESFRAGDAGSRPTQGGAACTH